MGLFGALKMQRNLSLSGGGERAVTARRVARGEGRRVEEEKEGGRRGWPDGWRTGGRVWWREERKRG